MRGAEPNRFKPRLTAECFGPYIDAPFFEFSRRRELLERIFHLQENQTTVRRELFAGLTTFHGHGLRGSESANSLRSRYARG